MKYQTEYQRNYQRRIPKKTDDYPSEPLKLNDVPIRRSSSFSPSRHRSQTAFVAAPRNNNSNFAVIGPNEKFASSQLYRLRQPVQDPGRVSKPKEYAILGRNEKFQDNVVYPLRKPVIDDTPAVTRRRQKSENHSCGIQTELEKAPRVSFDPRLGREFVPARSRIGAQSEYQQQFHWKESVGDAISDQMLVEESKLRDRRSDPVLPLTVIDPSQKLLAAKPLYAVDGPTPRLDFDIDPPRQLAARVLPAPLAVPTTTKEQISEYQSRYKPIVDLKKPRTRKAFEAEQAEERKRREIANAERAHTDDEGATDAVHLGKEFRQKHPQSNLRRWKSEYQTTYKPFWRFDYKNGKWYKDAEAEQSGFNPNLFWYKELVATRQQANEFRANAQADHFSRDHTLQLQTGQGGNKNFLAWDTNDDDDRTSVLSVDRDVERERQREQEAKRLNDGRIQARIHYERQKQNEIPTTSQQVQGTPTEQPAERVVYVDNPPPKQSSAATKALVRNLNSSSVQQHMSWDSDSLYSQRTKSDADFKSNTARDLRQKHYTNENGSADPSPVVRKPSANQQETRGTGTRSPAPYERPQTSHGYPSASPIQSKERLVHQNETSSVEPRHAAGRASYDTHALDKRAPSRPQSSTNAYRSYQGDRYKDEANDYQHQTREFQPQHDSPASKSSFRNHLSSLDHRFNGRQKDDDVLSVNSARSLSSSCSLASQTLELAQQNLHKYWGDK